MKPNQTTNQTRSPLWIQAQSSANVNNAQKKRNKLTEAGYHSILTAIKALYQPGELFYERNCIIEQSDNSAAMHTFMTKDCYWHFACDESYSFTIFYQFENPVIDAAVKTLPANLAISDRVVPVTLEPSLVLLFKRLKRLEQSKFFHLIKR